MYGQGKKKNPRSATLLMDWVHICIGLLIVILAVIAFLNPEDNRVLLPVIFLLAAILNVFTGVHKYRQSGRDRKKKAAALVQFVLAAVLFAVMAVSAISIWR
jgi:O-antigen/teichoic acid export membrane protein